MANQYHISRHADAGATLKAQERVMKNSRAGQKRVPSSPDPKKPENIPGIRPGLNRRRRTPGQGN